MKQQKKFKQTEIGKIPEDWEVKTFEETDIEIIDGDRGINYPKQEEFKNKGYCLFLSTKNTPNYKFDFSDSVFVTKERDDLLRKGKLVRGDIILTTRGTVGNVALYDEKIPFENIRINSGMVVLRNNDNFDTHFLYLLLRSSLVREQFLSFATGSAQPQLPIRDINKIRLILPSILEQHFIASILSSLDAKIELNQKMNKTLETIGQSLFKHWFIEFEFPNEKGKPYKSSGGEMIDSELGEIPKVWNIKSIKDFGQVICGKTPSTIDKDNFGLDYPFITIPDMHGKAFIVKTERKLSKVGVDTQKKKELPPLSVCVSCIATTGLVSLTTEPSYTNQQINSIICNKNISPYFMYLQMKNKEEEINIGGLGGTATLNLNTGNFEKIKLINPEQEVMKKFNGLVENIFQKILENSKEIESLMQIRDSLLPQLMSGKIRVPLEAKK